MKKIIDYMFFISLLLNFSEGFRPVGVLLGLSSSAVISAGTLALTIIYVIANQHTFKALMKKNVFKLWFTLLITYPIIALAFSVVLGFLSFGDFLYWISFNTMYGGLMIGAAIYAVKNDYRAIKRMALLSVIIALIGFVINYQNYSFSQKVLVFSNAGSASQDELYRALSFFPNPNLAALSLVLYMILLVSTKDGKHPKMLYYVVLFLSVTGMVFITGSRTSLILLAVIALFYIVPFIRREMKIKYNYSSSSSRLIILFFFAIAVFLFIGSFSFLSNFFSAYMSEDILSRMDFFSSVLSGDSVQDASLDDRTVILPKYFAEIGSNPIFGYGPQYIRDKLSSGAFANVSQNAFIEGAITFGVPYALLLFYCLYRTYRYSVQDKSVKDNFNTLKVVIGILFLISFSINNIFWMRSVVVTVGFLFGSSIRTLILNRLESEEEQIKVSI